MTEGAIMPKAKVFQADDSWRCGECGYTDPNKQRVLGHWVGNHVDRQLSLKAKKAKKETPTPLALVESKADEIDSIEAFMKWISAIPTASFKAVTQLIEENRKLKDENKKLRDTLTALISLAKEI